MSTGNNTFEEKEQFVKKPEIKGKSWKREHEERGQRQQREQNSITSPPDNNEECVLSEDNKIIHFYERENISEESNKETTKEPEQKVLSDEWKKKRKDSTEDDNENIGTKLGETGITSGEKTSSDMPKDVSDSTIEEDDEKRQLEAFVAETVERLAIKAELRASNTNAAANRPEEGFFTKLDSSLKKNTAFIKRLCLWNRREDCDT